MLDSEILCVRPVGHSKLSRNASAMVPFAHCGECNQKQNQNLLNHIEKGDRRQRGMDPEEASKLHVTAVYWVTSAELLATSNKVTPSPTQQTFGRRH